MFTKFIYSIQKNSFNKSYIVSRFFYLTLIIISLILIDSGAHVFFDHEHYINIAYNGYCKEYLFAFFPLIPLIIRIISPIGLIILNQICVYISCILIQKIKGSNSDYLIKIFLYSPIAVFSYFCYTESIFILLSLLVYYMYTKLITESILIYKICFGVLMGLCVCCRSMGCVLFFSIFTGMVINFIKKNIKLIDIISVYIPATLISCVYPVYLFITTGNFLKFIDAQSYWKKVKAYFFLAYKYEIQNMGYAIEDNDPLVLFLLICQIFFVTFLLILSITLLVKSRKSLVLKLMTVLTMLIVFSSCKTVYCPMASYYRYICSNVALYLLMDDDIPEVILITTRRLFMMFSIISTIFFTIELGAY